MSPKRARTQKRKVAKAARSTALAPVTAAASVIDPADASEPLREDLLASTTRLLASMRRLPAGEVTYERVLRKGEGEPDASGKAVQKYTVGEGILQRDSSQHSNVLPSNDDVHTIFTMAGALFPPYDPEMLVTLAEHSVCLRPNLDAYATNIDSFGHRLEPYVDLDSNESNEKIADAMFMSRLNDQQQQSPGTVAQASYPDPDGPEVAAKKQEIKALARLEHAKLTNLFEHVCAEYSFTELRRLSRIDLENAGNAYWEVLRNDRGEITQFVYIPGYSMRLMPIEHRHHEFAVRRRISFLDYEPVMVRRRFRRFVQVVLDRVVHFKEFGDPRVISRKTGQQFPSVEELKSADPDDGAATEVLHFKVHSPRSPYGIPRWIGALITVMGTRFAEQVNCLYFDNKAVPPMAILVSGGKLAESSKDKIASYIKDNIKGQENFHRILIVEAEPASPGAGLTENGRVRIELKPLMDAQQQDALFQNYDERNVDKVGMVFRLPRLLRGDIRDFNRATADAALEFAEVQVFQPERDRFDDIINRHLLTSMGIRFWKFVSQSPVNRNPIDVVTMTTQLGNAGAITPNEMRKLAAEALNLPFVKITEPWGDQPFPLTLAGIMPAELVSSMLGLPSQGAPTGPATPPDPTKPVPTPPPVGAKSAGADARLKVIAQGLMRLRAGLDGAAADEHKAMQDAWKRDGAGGGDIVIRLSASQMAELFEPGAAA